MQIQKMERSEDSLSIDDTLDIYVLIDDIWYIFDHKCNIRKSPGQFELSEDYEITIEDGLRKIIEWFGEIPSINSKTLLSLSIWTS